MESKKMDIDQPIRPTQLQTALFDYASAIMWINPTALTLTLKQRINHQSISIYTASANFRHFMSRLNRKIFGNAARRYGRGLRVVPVLEHDSLVRFHNHAVIDAPSNTSFGEFQNAIKAAWRKTEWGYEQMVIEPMTNDGWIHYIAKLRQKPEYDLAIDWMNVRSS